MVSRRATSGSKADSAANDGSTGATQGSKRLDRDLVDQLVVAIQDRIGSGEIPVGAWLRQEALAQELGVSRMPIREALRQMQTMGIIEIIANRGARVRLPSVRDIMEVLEVRGLLEGHAASEAAQHIASEQLDQMRDADAKFRQVIADIEGGKMGEDYDARPAWVAANTQFHAAMISASGNTCLANTIESLHRQIPRNLTSLALGNDVRLLQRNAEEHSRILEAIDAGDTETARQLAIEHIDNACRLIVRKLNETLTPKD